MLESFQERVLGEYPTVIKHMGTCLDLRKLSLPFSRTAPSITQTWPTLRICGEGRGPSRDTVAAQRSEEHSLHCLYDWMVIDGGLSMPPFDIVLEQHWMVRMKLNMLGEKESLAMMEHMFTESGFFTGVHDWLYLFNHMVLKTMNEAVIEGQGKFMNMHGTSVRNPTHTTLVMEAMLHYQGPHPAKCEAFLIRALDLHFAKNKDTTQGSKWHFLPVKGQATYTREFTSKVVERIMKETSKLPFLE
jgi:hypothetical protein